MVEIIEVFAIIIVSIAGFNIGWNLSEILKKGKK